MVLWLIVLVFVPLHGVCHFGWHKWNCENGTSSQRWRCLPRTDCKTSRDCSLKKKNQKLPCTLFTWFWLEWISGNKTEWAALRLSRVGANWNERNSDSLLFPVSPISVTSTQRFLPDNGCCYHIQIRYYPRWIVLLSCPRLNTTMTEHFISKRSCIIYAHRESRCFISALETLLTQKPFVGEN